MRRISSNIEPQGARRSNSSNVNPQGIRRSKHSSFSKQDGGLYRLSPRWSFIKCDMQHKKWGISTNVKYLAGMVARFKEWERITWGEILTTTSGRTKNTQNHPMPIDILNKQAIKRLAELHLDDQEILYSLTITGRQRIWGIMIEETGIFQLLWYDPNHEIYNVEQK